MTGRSVGGRGDGRRRRRSRRSRPSCRHARSTRWPTPTRADEMDELVERFGDVQARFEELGGYALEGRAREVLAGLGFSQEMMDGDVGALSGGWKMRVALARILLMQPDAMLLDEPTQPPRPRVADLAREFLKGYEGALLMTSHDREFMNRIVTKIVEIDGGELNAYSGNYEFYEQQRALNEKQQQAHSSASRRCWRRRCVHRALQGAGLPGRAGAVAGEEARQDRKRRAAEAPPDDRLRLPAAPRSGDDVVKLERVHKAYGSRSDLRGLRLPGPAQRALVRDGRQRRRQVDAAQARRRRDRAGRRGGRARRAA